MPSDGSANTRREPFRRIELDGSFYALQTPACYASWYVATPKDLACAVKGSLYTTHMLELRNIENALPDFLASGLFNLREKPGPFLWQFSPTFRSDEPRFAAFLASPPRDTAQALRRRDARMHGRSRLAIDAFRTLRHAVKIRDPRSEIRRPPLGRAAAPPPRRGGDRRYGGQLARLRGRDRRLHVLRLHGEEELSSSAYADDWPARWASPIRTWD
ncbi:MAG: DUF72 domain-containing protein [Casimicrobiaceae bacterium]